MGVGTAVKKGFQIVGQSMPVVWILFAFGALWNLVNFALTTNNPQAAEALDLGSTLTLLGAGLVFLLISIFLQAGSLGYVRDRVKQGTATLSVFTQCGRKYYFGLLGVGVLIGLFVILLVVVLGLLMGILGPQRIALSFGLAVVLGGLGIYGVLLMFLAPYVLVVQDQKVFSSIGQSVAFTRKNLLAVVGLVLILLVIGFAVGFLLGIVFALLSLAIKGMISQIIFMVASSFVNAFLGLFVTGAFMNFYLGRSASAANNTAGA